MTRNTAVTMATRNGVRKRDLHRCQRCNKPCPDGHYNLQHRAPRASGGSQAPFINQATNLVVLCGTSATDPDGCHHWVESNRREALLFGWSVLRNVTTYLPEGVPMRGFDEHGAEQWYWLEGFDRIPVQEETALMRLVSLGIREDAS